MIHDWRVSPQEGLLTRDNETVRLEPKAMEVLACLASRPGEVVTREELEREVWRGALVGYDAVTNTIIKLRKALNDDAREPRFIATIPKKGYQLIAPITYLSAEEDRISLSPVAPEPGKGSQQERPTRLTQKKLLMAVSLAAMLVIGLTWLWPLTPFSIASVSPGGNQSNIALPSIVVLPFENLSNDPKQDFLADGITEDIVTDLSRLSSLMVIASNPLLSNKDEQVPIEKIGTDMNVDFVLKGSIRRIEDEVRVNVQLVNAKTGVNVWGQRYDRKLTEVFAVQDEVTRSIVNALAIRMTSQEETRLAQRATDNLKAYDFFQEGQRITRGRTRPDIEQARGLYQKAIEVDPHYGRAYGAIAYTLALDYLRGWTDTPVETLDRALVLAKQAVALDESTPQTYWALGFVHLMRKEYASAEEAVTQSVLVAPNYADGYALLALIKVMAGQPKQGVDVNEKAMHLNPYYTWEYLYTPGAAYYMLGNYEAAIKTLEKAEARNQSEIIIKLFLAASYVKAGRQDDAEWTAIQLQTLNPVISISDLEKSSQISDPKVRQAFLDDLRKAGLPE